MGWGAVSDTGGTAELAEFLRELKGRSGLSYGALAKRLHMSTSTLHRYCNGDAVPTEFAPVERLARLCRATPDEMVGVHRLWILADAARGKREAQPGRADAGTQPVRAGSEGHVVRPDAEADTESPAPAPVGAEPGAESGPLVSLRGAGGDAESGGSSTGGRSGAFGRNGRRNVLIGVGTVLAVVASTVLVTQLVGGARDEGAGGQPVGAASSPVPDAPGGGSPAGAEPKTHPSVSPSRTATGSASPTTLPSADPPGREKPQDAERDTDRGGQGGDGTSATGTPFVTAVRPYVYETPCSQYFLVDSRPQKVAPPPSEQDAPGWAASYRAVPADEQLIALTLQGRSKETVVLEALHVRVVRSEAPLPWTRYATGVGCGGNVDTKSFTVDLDAGRPATVPHAGQRDFPYKVSETDPEVFYVKASARAHAVSWYLELVWSSGGRRGVERIDAGGGKPFRTSGSVGRPTYHHPLGSSAWEKPLDDDS
ncbi:transcriptional regulator [Streptomyces candidus]|uniref:Transcriptional regulator with XRE-family HTH domain n=1 Tax=Streptomyces candidus TaxID=67283 RepID=A0A7X0LNR8_9ACTN|nr:transcriptional regulator [Streptomyces candidus]MBB6434759.1 transcriptional regulator with XRE-family HTH domain [Streptomyces candidus]GHH42014.1 transcriptional regulator [Streptomyces candidus]